MMPLRCSDQSLRCIDITLNPVAAAADRSSTLISCRSSRLVQFAVAAGSSRKSPAPACRRCLLFPVCCRCLLFPCSCLLPLPTSVTDPPDRNLLQHPRTPRDILRAVCDRNSKRLSNATREFPRGAVRRLKGESPNRFRPRGGEWVV